MSIVTLPSAATPARAANRRPEPPLPILWLRRIRSRRTLAALHPEQIRDAGIDPNRLRAEIRKPFWRR